MQCANCKKDLVPGYTCEPCDAIMNKKLVEVLNEPIVLPVEEVKEMVPAKVKKVTKSKKK